MARRLRGGAGADFLFWALLVVALPSVALASSKCSGLTPQSASTAHSFIQTARKSPHIFFGPGRGQELPPDWWQNVTSPTEMDSAVRRAIRDGQAPMIQRLANIITSTIQWAQHGMLESAQGDKAKGDKILDDARAQMTICATGLNQVAVLAANASYQSAGAAHRECRQAEGELSVLKQGILAELIITMTAEDAECAGVGELVDNETAEAAQPGEQTDDVEKVRRTHVLQEQLSLQKIRCEDARRANADKRQTVSIAGTDWLKRQTECDAAQDELEFAACALAVEVRGQCSNYTRCYGTSKDTYDVLAATHKKWVDDRKAEWTLSRQIECVVDLLGQGAVSVDGDGEEWMFEDCKARHHGDVPLEFGLPALGAPEAEACGLVGDLYPCTDAFVAKEYVGLPEDAPGKKCTPCSALSSAQEDADDTSQQQLPLPLASSAGDAEIAPPLPTELPTATIPPMPVLPASSAGDDDIVPPLPAESLAGNATAQDDSESEVSPDQGARRNSTEASPTNLSAAAANEDATNPGNDTEGNSTERIEIDTSNAEDGKMQPNDANELVQSSAWADGLFDVTEDP